jgi:ferredoxin
MPKRKIIEIERNLCDGCGLCTTACMEGALELDEDNKAVLVKEIYCDGMGACLDVCPTGALKIVERESPSYDPKATYRHVATMRGESAARHVHGVRPESRTARKNAGPESSGCPGSRAGDISRQGHSGPDPSKAVSGRSELTQWPIQLHLVSPLAPYWDDADLLIAADCTAFSFGRFHPDLLKGKKLVIACPKLDDTVNYVEKLADLLSRNEIRSFTVAIMTVPCCSGLFRMVEEAVAQSGTKVVPKKIVIGIDGTLM